MDNEFPSLFDTQSGQRAHIGKSRFVVGRSADADVLLVDPSCSRLHFAIVAIGECFSLEPLSETAPTLLNLKQINSPQLLSHGDSISAGDSVFRFLMHPDAGICADDKSQYSVTEWIQEWKGGSEAALNQLWERYYQKIQRMAKSALRSSHRVVDEDDIASMVFVSLLKAVEAGKYQQLKNREDLIRLLSRITRNKAIDQIKYLKCVIRGSGQVRGDSVYRDAALSIPESDAQEPLELQLWREREEGLLSHLDDELREIAVKKNMGYTNREIAELLACSVPTVERRLAKIRAILRPFVDAP